MLSGERTDSGGLPEHWFSGLSCTSPATGRLERGSVREMRERQKERSPSSLCQSSLDRGVCTGGLRSVVRHYRASTGPRDWRESCTTTPTRQAAVCMWWAARDRFVEVCVLRSVSRWSLVCCVLSAAYTHTHTHTPSPEQSCLPSFYECVVREVWVDAVGRPGRGYGHRLQAIELTRSRGVRPLPAG